MLQMFTIPFKKQLFCFKRNTIKIIEISVCYVHCLDTLKNIVLSIT
jgi:hypothetical protein